MTDERDLDELDDEQPDGIRYPSTAGKSLQQYAAEAEVALNRARARAAFARGLDSSLWDDRADEALDRFAVLKDKA